MKEVRLGLGIDHGFGNIKTKHAVFKAAVKWYEQEPEVLKHVVGYRNAYYVTGGSAVWK